MPAAASLEVARAGSGNCGGIRVLSDASKKAATVRIKKSGPVKQQDVFTAVARLQKETDFPGINP
jgi:hypothetical protein